VHVYEDLLLEPQYLNSTFFSRRCSLDELMFRLKVIHPNHFFVTQNKNLKITIKYLKVKNINLKLKKYILKVKKFLEK
jgi:hypothetical protein